MLRFKPGESTSFINVTLVNDPSGKTRYFTLTLDDVRGRDDVGKLTSCKVVVANKACEFLNLKKL